MRYHVSEFPTPCPDIVTDNNFSSSSIFAVVAYALTKNIDTISVNCLHGDLLARFTDRTTIFMFSTLPEYAKNYCTWCPTKRKTGIPYGVAGAAWTLFGNQIISKLKTDIKGNEAWSIIDSKLISKFDATEFEDDTCRRITNKSINPEEFEQACIMLESQLCREIKKLLSANA